MSAEGGEGRGGAPGPITPRGTTLDEILTQALKVKGKTLKVPGTPRPLSYAMLLAAFEKAVKHG